MPDLAAVLGRAEGVINSVLTTSGCTVGLRRPKDPAGDVVDPATLAVTDSTQAKYATGLAAVVAPDTGQSDGQPARPASTLGARVVLRDEDATVSVQERDEVIVETARDSALVGREYAVTAIQRNGAGIVVVLRCAPVGRP